MNLPNTTTDYEYKKLWEKYVNGLQFNIRVELNAKFKKMGTSLFDDSRVRYLEVIKEKYPRAIV